MRLRFSGTGYIALAAVMWSTGGVLIKLVDADPLLIAAARALIAGLILLPFVRPKQLKICWQMLLFILCYGCLITSFVVSTKLTTAANAIALQSTAPLWVFLSALVIKRKVVWRQALPVGLIALGLVSIILEPTVGTSTLGNIVALCSGVLFASVTALLRNLGGENSLGLISICNLAVAPFIWILVPEGAGIFDISQTGWIVLFILGVVQLGIPYVFYTIGLRSTTPQKATMVALLEPILNPVWVFIFLGEIPTPYGIIGGAFIIIGLIADTLVNVPCQNRVEFSRHNMNR